MAYFKHYKSDTLVTCYGATQCSSKRTAELTDPRLIEKARNNPHFIEVDKAMKQTRKRKSKK